MTCPWDKHIFNTKKIQEQLKIDFKLQYKIYLINHKSKPHAGRRPVKTLLIILYLGLSQEKFTRLIM